MVTNAHCHPAAAIVQARPAGLPADWLVPDWPAPAHVHALFTTRAGGVSEGGYTSMNLGRHVGDAPHAVAQNRERLAATLQTITPGAQPVFLNQVHGTDCAQLSNNVPGGSALDAAITSEPGVVCTIMVADCLPVLLADRAGLVVGAAHAGWRGLAGGVLEALFRRFMPLAQAEYAQNAMKTIAYQHPLCPDDLMAWLGPCIGPAAFEVGAEVRAAFCAEDADAEQHFTAGGDGQYFADLPGLARRRLTALGVTAVYGNDGSDAWCTSRQASRFFSHRRDGVRTVSADGTSVGGDAGRVAGTGRMAACIWLGGGL